MSKYINGTLDLGDYIIQCSELEPILKIWLELAELYLPGKSTPKFLLDISSNSYTYETLNSYANVSRRGNVVWKDNVEYVESTERDTREWTRLCDMFPPWFKYYFEDKFPKTYGIRYTMNMVDEIFKSGHSIRLTPNDETISEFQLYKMVFDELTSLEKYSHWDISTDYTEDDPVVDDVAEGCRLLETGDVSRLQDRHIFIDKSRSLQLTERSVFGCSHLHTYARYKAKMGNDEVFVTFAKYDQFVSRDKLENLFNPDPTVSRCLYFRRVLELRDNVMIVHE